MLKRIVVTGATGNVGTSVVRGLAADPLVGSVVGIARRRPEWTVDNVTWHTADLAEDDVDTLLAGADVLVHLAWMIQPARDPATTWRTNVVGSLRLFDAAVRAGVPALIHASSVGAYSPGPKNRAVTEDWPTHGWPAASYPREKSYLERVLDTVERDNPSMRVVRMRPAFMYKREASSAPIVLRRGDIRGPVNLAADPVLDAHTLADVLGARVVKLPVQPIRTALAAAWRPHATPASPTCSTPRYDCH